MDNIIPISYTDGSCVNGCGGWAFYLKDNENREWLGRCDVEETTNNRMELLAVINCLKMCQILNINCIKIHCDSQLTISCGKKEWKRNKNLDLWEIFDALNNEIKIIWIKVKAHSGIDKNELVDKFAKNIKIK